MSKKLTELSLIDVMQTVQEKVFSEYVRENTCGNYHETKRKVRDFLNRCEMTYITDNQVTMLVNRDWRSI